MRSGPPHKWGGVARRATEGPARKSKSLALDELSVDPAGNFGQVVIYVGDIHTDDAVAQRLQPRLSSDVVLPLSVIIVGRTVDLNDKPSSWTAEVREVGANWMLAPKFPPVKLPRLQAGPDTDLGMAHRLAHSLRSHRLERRHTVTIAGKEPDSNPGC